MGQLVFVKHSLVEINVLHIVYECVNVIPFGGPFVGFFGVSKQLEQSMCVMWSGVFGGGQTEHEVFGVACSMCSTHKCALTCAFSTHAHMWHITHTNISAMCCNGCNGHFFGFPFTESADCPFAELNN